MGILFLKYKIVYGGEFVDIVVNKVYVVNVDCCIYDCIYEYSVCV